MNHLRLKIPQSTDLNIYSCTKIKIKVAGRISKIKYYLKEIFQSNRKVKPSLNCLFSSVHDVLFLPVKVDPSHVSVIVFGGKLWYAMTDPVCGYLVNRTKSSSWGKYKPW